MNDFKITIEHQGDTVVTGTAVVRPGIPVDRVLKFDFDKWIIRNFTWNHAELAGPKSDFNGSTAYLVVRHLFQVL